MALCSVCIPTFNRPDMLRKAIESVLLDQSIRAEIIVTDSSENASAAEIVKDYDVNYYPCPCSGLDNWRNALRYANGEFVVLLHDDDLLGVGVLKRHSDFLLAHSSVALVTGARIYQTGNGHFIEQTEWSKEVQILPGKEMILNMLFYGNVIGETASVMFRRCFTPKINLDDGWLADVGMWADILLNGDFGYIPEIAAYITHHSQNTFLDMLKLPDYAEREREYWRKIAMRLVR